MEVKSGLDFYSAVKEKGFTVRANGFIGRGVEIRGLSNTTDVLICIPSTSREDFEVEDEN